MNTFYIYFGGLICHVGKNKNDVTKRKHASLVNAPSSHEPRLYFSETDYEVLNTTPAHAVKFKGGSGNATMEPSFASVPSLKRLLDKGSTTDAKHSVYNKMTPHLHVDYPRVNGTGSSVKLATAMLYPKQVIHKVDGVPQPPVPAARLVVAIVNTDDSELVLKFNGHERKLTLESPCMIVANIERKPESDPDPCDEGNNHFKLYGHLLDDPKTGVACDDGASIQIDFQGCDWVDKLVHKFAHRKFRAATSTECGNTQWP